MTKLDYKWLTTNHKHEHTNPYINKLKQSKKTDISFPVLVDEELKESLSLQNMSAYEGVFLEIGCHKGKVLSELALANRDSFFVGFDITYKRVFLSAQRSKQAGLSNVKLVKYDGSHTDRVFAPQSLAGVIIFFPDPWSKKLSQKHNRMLDQKFCLMIKSLLQCNAFVWFKTDDKNYYDLLCHYMYYAGFRESKQKCNITTMSCESIFEKRYREKELPIYEKIWRK
jgi:tRNA (guanine-N7-)-methyltransferase